MQTGAYAICRFAGIDVLEQICTLAGKRMCHLPLRGDSMRLFTNISFLTALLAIFGCSVTATVAVLVFGCSHFILAFIIPVSCLCYFLSLLIAHFIAQPLTELAQKTRAYREGDKSIVFEPTGALYEVDQLSEDFRELNRAYEAKLDELSKMQDRQDSFVSDVAHEFRTPLTAISGNAELMLDPDMPQSTREHFCEIILSESERLKKLTNSLLALQHAKEGVPAAALKRLDIAPVAQEVIEMLEPIAQDKNITLSVEGAAPDILGNTDRLKQAIINLVDNAIRHVEEGGHVRVLLSGVNDQAIIAVKDDGCGIEDDPSLLFKRFYRSDASRARNSGGAGLGLAIVKEIVESFDGTVTAFNAPEGGAVFVMAFPAL